MKAIFNKLIILASVVLAFTACNDDEGKTDTRLTSVKSLIEPIEAKSVVLQPTASATMYFEWEPCKVEESGTALYQIAFDKADGNFSNPVYIAYSDNNGLRSFSTISHKQMNKIAGMMGIGPSATGTFKWTVFSSKGLSAKQADQSHSITITRLAGFADVPIDVFVTGEGSEGGTDLSKAHKMKAVAGGEFEVYTKLTAGKTYKFVDGITGTPRSFYTDGGLVKENGTSTIAKTGLYRITLDFNTGACSYTEITNLGLFFSPSNSIIFNLDYTGYGVWKASSKPVTFHQESWGRDERYKFRMMTKSSAGADVEWEWGTLNGTDSRPNASSPDSYYYTKIQPLTQWDNKWKFAGEMDNALVDVTFYLTADKPYTHSVKKVGNQ